VSPVTLMLRSKGWRVLSELPHAIVLVIRGRLPLKSLTDGLLNRNRMRNVEELDVIARALQEDQT
jgi:hypothetical protein